MKLEFCSNQSFQKLFENLISHYKRIGYHPATIANYEKAARVIQHFLEAHNCVTINEELYQGFRQFLLDGRNISNVSRKDLRILRCLNATLEYAACGSISFRSYRKPSANKRKTEIENQVEKHLADVRKQNRVSKTISTKREYLNHFCSYLQHHHNIDRAESIGPEEIIRFCIHIRKFSMATTHCILCALRGFLRFLQSEGITESDFSYLVPKDNYKRQAKLPSCYTREEINKMLLAVDRASPKGKRDYAMMLLSVYFGMRASDVCALEFDNIDWQKNIICYRQQKTKHPVELPLLAEVGNALIDYIRYGRPESYSNKIFLHANGRYAELNKETFHSIVTRYLLQAGVSISGKKHGPHALRHSLASRLLESEVPLPVISESLGHKCSESTMLYLRIDLKHLKQCALDVPALNSNFYGGGD